MARDPYEYFRIEACEIVDGLGRRTLELERGATPELTSTLLRLAHTLKGAARVVRQPDIAARAHAIEEALAPVRDDGAAVGRDLIDRVLVLTDEISSLIAALGTPSDVAAKAQSAASAEDNIRSVRADSADLDVLLEGLSEASVQLHRMGRSASLLEQARRLADTVVEQSKLNTGSKSGSSSSPLSPIKLRAAAEELRAALTDLERGWSPAIEQTRRELREVRDAAERLRLPPVSLILTSLQRITRDTALALGKDATFSTEGADIRLDAHVLGVVQGALLQMVRNAVAHGIEPPAERERLGKPRAGCVTVAITRSGNGVAFACRDDGQGIDLDAVRRVAERRGVISRDAAVVDSPHLLSLLLGGGLTTARAVTQASGRGIGLDVVRDAVARLGGDIKVDTAPGKGTTFTLTAPLSLSATEALLVEAGGVSAAIPLGSIRRTLRLAPSDVTRTPEGEAIALEGRIIPFVPLRCSLGQRSTGHRVPISQSAVVIESSAALTAVGIGTIKGLATVVVRPLPALAPHSGVVAGASLDVDGTPQIVLDPEGLAADARHHANAEPAPTVEAATVVLVIDDSLTTRMMERSILESAGYEVDLATSAEEGLEKAQQRQYHLFLVDVEMPGMDGFSFVERTRADRVLREVPAILVTSRNAPEDHRRGQEVGASGYIVKGDFDQTALLSTIRRLVGR